MENFVFYNPVKIIFGKGEIARVAKEIPVNSKVMVLYGRGSIKKNFVYDAVKDALKHHDWLEFGGIEPNPKYETLMRAVDIIQKENVDFLLAAGGGSVIDGTKFVAAASKYEGEDSWDMLAKAEKVKAALPLGVVLTIPATGSEMNSTAVISRNSTKEKLPLSHPRLFPQFSVLDPEVVYSLPEKQVQNGIVDAYVHVLEQYLTYPVQAEVQDRWAEGVLKALMDTGPKILQDQKNYNNAANLMWEATMALNGILRCGVPEDWSTHMIGHEITALHGIDHAETLAMVLPGVMQEMREEKSEKLLQYAGRVMNVRDDIPHDKRIDQVIEKTEHFFKSMGMQIRLSDHGINMSTIDEIEKRFRQRPGFDALGEHENMNPSRVRNILESRL
ncbi:MAG: iron-containing alcohol dehydrogenase [Candidatus Delongbacteria bacterium]|nr:iron-containing alcohol dehydrogenase [Candidatus Delongbacteria bacterium]